MKLLPAILLIISCVALSPCSSAQTLDEDSSVVEYVPMNRAQLARYRQSIWDSLPIAVGWVNDFEGLFTMEQENNLQNLITHFEKASTIEIMIVTIDTNMVAKENFSDFSYRLLKIWGIGKRLKENGIVICISSGYKTLQVTCDFGIDNLMDESTKNRIIAKYFINPYKRNKYYEGTYNGLNAIITHLSKKIKAVGGADMAF
jgi:uncharacterized protein